MENRRPLSLVAQESSSDSTCNPEESRLVDTGVYTRYKKFRSVWLKPSNSESSNREPSITYSTESLPTPDNEKKESHKERRPRLHRLCRSLGLESLYLFSCELLGGYDPEEEKKVALIYDLRTACYVSLVHIVPAGASITLIAFNWRGYYIGKELRGPSGEDGLRFLGLQFAAKILELLAMGSLSCILFALVRYQLVFGSSLPFGALTAGFEFSRLSLLWSKEFMATCSTKFASWKMKLGLIATIVVFTILGASIGPSAAVAAQPTLGDWKAGGTGFWLNSTSEELWPTRLDTVATADLPCLSPAENNSCFPSNYGLIASEILSLWPLATTDTYGQSQAMPENTRISGRHALRNLAMRFKGPFTYQPDLTVTTTPSAAIADAVSKIGQYWFIANTHRCYVTGLLNGFCYYNDIQYSVTAPQPISFVRCNSNAVNATLQFPRLDKGLAIFPLVEYSNETLAESLWAQGSGDTTTSPTLSWVELPEADFGNSSIEAVIVLPSTIGTSSEVLSCTVDARWANATAIVSFLGGPRMASGVPGDGWYLTGREKTLSDGLLAWPQVKITPSWAYKQYQNSTIGSSSNGSVFTNLVNNVGRLNNISNVPDLANAIGTVLAVMITDAMARTGSTATIQGSLKDPAKNSRENEMFPQKTVFRNGGEAFNFSPSNANETGFVKLQLRTTVNGYGYGLGTAPLLSTITLLVYLIIALTYVIYSTCLARTTSNSWESITEMIALAVNSKPPSSDALKNTGAGISTLEMLKQTVRVRVRDEHLQMCFEEGVDVRVLKNERYS